VADKVPSPLFDFLDDIARRDESHGQTASWTEGRCPQCGQVARHSRRPAAKPDATVVPIAVNVVWVCLACGVFSGPIAA